MTTRTIALRLDDESPLYQAIRRFAYENGIMKLSQAATMVLSETLLMDKDEESHEENPDG